MGKGLVGEGLMGEVSSGSMEQGPHHLCHSATPESAMGKSGVLTRSQAGEPQEEDTHIKWPDARAVRREAAGG